MVKKCESLLFFFVVTQPTLFGAAVRVCLCTLHTIACVWKLSYYSFESSLGWDNNIFPDVYLSVTQRTGGGGGFVILVHKQGLTITPVHQYQQNVCPFRACSSLITICTVR